MTESSCAEELSLISPSHPKFTYHHTNTRYSQRESTLTRTTRTHTDTHACLLLVGAEGDVVFLHAGAPHDGDLLRLHDAAGLEAGQDGRVGRDLEVEHHQQHPGVAGQGAAVRVVNPAAIGPAQDRLGSRHHYQHDHATEVPPE